MNEPTPPGGRAEQGTAAAAAAATDLPGTARRIGLLGGTFDPVHSAHLALAHAALQGLQLHSLRWIPAGRPWQKTRPITAAVHREAMVKLAIAGEPQFELDRIEIERQGASYTLDTVRELQARESAALWFLVIGHDQYAALHTWAGWQELLSRVTLAVANRPGPAAAVNAEVLQHPHQAVQLPMLDISSTDIRQRVARGLDISKRVPSAVASYIETHRLYRAT